MIYHVKENPPNVYANNGPSYVAPLPIIPNEYAMPIDPKTITINKNKKIMTREELQQKLQELATRKENAIRRHDARRLEIQDTQQEALRGLNSRKHAFLTALANERAEIDKRMRADSQLETTRYKLACIAIEDERQQLFADYKASNPTPESGAASVKAIVNPA